MKLIQIGASWCRPCVIAKKELPNELYKRAIAYEYVEIPEDSLLRKKMYNTYPAAKGTKGIPIFLIEKDGEQKLFKVGYGSNFLKELDAIGS